MIKKIKVIILLTFFGVLFVLTGCSSDEDAKKKNLTQNSEKIFQGGGMMGKGTTSKCAMMVMPRTGISSEQLPDKDSKVVKKYAQLCSQCHLLQSPKMKSARQWPGIVDRMDRRMQRMASMGMMRRRMKTMTSQDKKKVMAYLQKHALKVMSNGSIKGFSSLGGQKFKQTCTQCHDLPDPKQHSAKEWKRVIQRMKKNMAQMGKTVISQKEEQLILDFLKENASK